MDAMTLPKEIPRSHYVVRYAGKNVTVDLAKYLTSLTYTDHLSGQSDELELDLEDTDGRWRDSWYPGKGDTLEVEIGWHGEPLTHVGRFVIDEIIFGGGPSTVSIRALAASIDVAVRTTEYVAYENTTLDAIAQKIAQRNGLELTGAIEPIKLDRLTQSESDGAFLTKLADEYDYAFKIVGKRLVFHTITELMAADPVARVELGDLKPGWTIRDQMKDVPRAVEVKSHNPATGKLVAYEVQNDGTVKAVPGSVSKATSSADTVKKSGRASSNETATAKARAQLARTNRERTVGNAHLMGRPRLVAGSVIDLVGGHLLDGGYLIQTSRHQMNSSGGYDLEIDFCRIRTEVAEPAAGKPKAPASKPAKKAGGKLVTYGMKDGDVVRT